MIAPRNDHTADEALVLATSAKAIEQLERDRDALDAIEARVIRGGGRLTYCDLPAYDSRTMIEQLVEGVDLLKRAMVLFADPGNVATVASFYCLVWEHSFGPDWHTTPEALAVLGRYADGHSAVTAWADQDGYRSRPITPHEHTSGYYGAPDELNDHLVLDHGFPSGWTMVRELQAHAAVHHVLPVIPGGWVSR